MSSGASTLTNRVSLGLHRSQGFDDVPISEDGVETEAYLEATVGLVKMFGESRSIILLYRMILNLECRLRTARITNIWFCTW